MLVYDDCERCTPRHAGTHFSMLGPMVALAPTVAVERSWFWAAAAPHYVKSVNSASGALPLVPFLQVPKKNLVPFADVLVAFFPMLILAIFGAKQDASFTPAAITPLFSTDRAFSAIGTRKLIASVVTISSQQCKHLIWRYRSRHVKAKSKIGCFCFFDI